jgi:predicted amidohydrolase
MRITTIQFGLRGEDKATSLARALALIDGAAGSDLILLPELWPTGYFAFDRYRADAERLDGPLVSALARKAKELRTHIFAGSLVETDGERLYNTAILLGPDGGLLASYRKIHLFGFQSDERKLLTAGDRVVVVDTPWGRTGLSTCYDLRFPELYRRMVDQGAQVFLVTAAWPRQRTEAWNLFNRARAHENLAFLLSCNCGGQLGSAAFAGCSTIVDPLGVVVAQAGTDEQLLTAEIDPGQVARARASFTALDDRVLNRPAKGSHG